MQKKLDDADARAIRIRIFVSRVTRKITENEIAEAFGISLSTLQRYKLDRARELSRTYARKQYQRFALEREENRGHCFHCGIEATEHPRCKMCEIFLHTSDSGLGGSSEDGKYCLSCSRVCFDNNEDYMLSPLYAE